MSHTASLFAKWRGQIQSLLRPFQNLIIFKKMADGFEASLKPHAGESPYWADLVTWMLINYISNTASSIRRLSDKDTKAISVRGLLESVKKNASVITPANITKYCKHVTINGKPPKGTKSVEKAVDDDIQLIIDDTKPVHDFVDTMIAHHDPKSHTITPPSLEQINIAIETLHKVYRKWAYYLANMRCNLDDPDPMDLLPEDPPDYEPQFRQMWNALSTTTLAGY